MWCNAVCEQYVMAGVPWEHKGGQGLSAVGVQDRHQQTLLQFIPPLHLQCHVPLQALSTDNWTITKLVMVSLSPKEPSTHTFSILLLDLLKMQIPLHAHFTLLKAHQ